MGNDDQINEAARLLSEPLETDPMRELRVVVNARLQTYALTADRALLQGDTARYFRNDEARRSLEWVIAQIDASLPGSPGTTDTLLES